MSLASASIPPGRMAAPPITGIGETPNLPGVIILAHRDAQVIAIAIKRLLDAEGRNTRIYFGIDADGYVVPNPMFDRVVVIWSRQSAADPPLKGIALSALAQNALVEVQIGDLVPEIAGRTVQPVVFTDWNQTRAGQWKVFSERLVNASHREIVTRGHVKNAAAALIVTSGFIFIPAVVYRALDTGLSDPGATSIVAPIVEQVDFEPPTLHLNENMRLDPPAETEEAFARIEASRPIRMRSMPLRPAPRIASLDSADPLVQVEFRRRGIVGQILAAADNIPLRSDERNQNN